MSLRRAAPPAPPRRAGRAATFAFGAVIAAASSGCGESHTPGADAGRDEDAGVDSGTIMSAYGAPPIDAGPPPIDAGPPPTDAGDTEDAGPTADAGPDGGQDAGFFPPYGTPPVDGDHALV